MAINLQEDFMYMGTTAQVFACRFTFLNVPAVTRDRTITRHEKMGWFPNIDNSGNIWRMHYWNLGQNLNRMIDWAAEENQWDYVGAGYAIQAWSWLTLTDYHRPDKANWMTGSSTSAPSHQVKNMLQPP